MNTSFQKLLIGGSGVVASKIAETSSSLSPDQITEGGSLLVQIIIAVVTLFGLFKRKKSTNN